MTTKQLSQALSLAMDPTFKTALADPETYRPIYNLAIFDGYGLSSFQPVPCTLEMVAALIRWECVNMNGTVDEVAMANLIAIKERFAVAEPAGEAIALRWMQSHMEDQPRIGTGDWTGKKHWYAEIVLKTPEDACGHGTTRVTGTGDTLLDAIKDCEKRCNAIGTCAIH